MNSPAATKPVSSCARHPPAKVALSVRPILRHWLTNAFTREVEILTFQRASRGSTTSPLRCISHVVNECDQVVPVRQNRLTQRRPPLSTQRCGACQQVNSVPLDYGAT